VEKLDADPNLRREFAAAYAAAGASNIPDALVSFERTLVTTVGSRFVVGWAGGIAYYTFTPYHFTSCLSSNPSPSRTLYTLHFSNHF